MKEAKPIRKHYDKPSMKVYPLSTKPRLLVGSDNPDWYDNPGGPGQF